MYLQHGFIQSTCKSKFNANLHIHFLFFLCLRVATASGQFQSSGMKSCRINSKWRSSKIIIIISHATDPRCHSYPELVFFSVFLMAKKTQTCLIFQHDVHNFFGCEMTSISGWTFLCMFIHPHVKYSPSVQTLALSQFMTVFTFLF